MPYIDPIALPQVGLTVIVAPRCSGKTTACKNLYLQYTRSEDAFTNRMLVIPVNSVLTADWQRIAKPRHPIHTLNIALSLWKKWQTDEIKYVLVDSLHYQVTRGKIEALLDALPDAKVVIVSEPSDALKYAYDRALHEGGRVIRYGHRYCGIAEDLHDRLREELSPKHFTTEILGLFDEKEGVIEPPNS